MATTAHRSRDYYAEAMMRFLWRWGIKPMMWALRLLVIVVLIGVCDLLLKLEPSGWAMVGMIALYGIWAISTAIREHGKPVNYIDAQTVHLHRHNSKVG